MFDMILTGFPRKALDRYLAEKKLARSLDTWGEDSHQTRAALVSWEQAEFACRFGKPMPPRAMKLVLEAANNGIPVESLRALVINDAIRAEGTADPLIGLRSPHRACIHLIRVVIASIFLAIEACHLNTLGLNSSGLTATLIGGGLFALWWRINAPFSTQVLLAVRHYRPRLQEIAASLSPGLVTTIGRRQ